MLTRKLCIHALLGLLLTAVCVMLPRTGLSQTADEYRETLFDVIGLLDQVSVIDGFQVNDHSINLAIAELIQLTDEEIQDLFVDALPLPELERLIENAQAEIDTYYAQIAQRSSIDIPDVDVDPSFCASTTGAQYFVALAIEKAVKAIFAALKFECLQEVLGENSALLCVAAAVEVLLAEETTEFAQFCRDEIRAAKGRAILELDQNIGAYLNEFVDDTTTSSRATQDSVDDLQVDVTTTLSDIDSVQSDLDAGFTTLDSDLNTALTDLTALADDLTDLIAAAADIQFRTQENQVDIEDVQTSTADLQSTTDEIRTDTQSIIGLVADLQASTDDLINSIDGSFAQLQDDAIAAVLANPDAAAAEYALPQSAGGQLEIAREVVIQAVNDLQSLGLGNTSAALQLISQGDQAYNTQNYVAAYNAFAEAYRVLTTVGMVRRGDRYAQ